jgi:hydroxymethylpyrimidine/phosphomethylpyrimidine kinase
VFGVHGCTVFAALTAQNPFGVRSVLTVDPGFVGEQLDACWRAYSLTALKTGMLASPEVIDVVADRLVCLNRIAKVVDPVMVATSGARLLQDGAVERLKARLLPLAALITPNLPETDVLLDRTVSTRRRWPRRRARAVRRLRLRGAGQGRSWRGRQRGRRVFRRNRPGPAFLSADPDPLSTHGTGCSLSAAIAASLACGKTLLDAAIDGKAYVYEAIRTGEAVGEVAAVLGTPARIPVEAIAVEPLAS